MCDEKTPSPARLLPGKILQQFVKCNKERCRCHDGAPHGPYHYRVWRDGNKVHKVYVSLENLEADMAACEAHREAAARERAGRRR